MLYEDNPQANLAFLKTLTPKQITYYVKGYIMACVHMREAITGSRTELLEALLVQENESSTTTLLNSGISLLDIYESAIEKRETTILKLFPEISQ